MSTKPAYSVPLHGNYHGYYQKRGSDLEGDERLTLLPSDIFTGKRVLDVGCNEGFVTCEIAQRRSASYVVGVDIDSDLVALAWKRRRYLWSLQQPTGGLEDSDTQPPSTTSRKRKRNDVPKTGEAVQQPTTLYYFPAALQHMFGPLPLTRAHGQGINSFPHNVTFVASDWVTTGTHLDADGYDMVLALSVTKWIHLNDGDDGIRAFFRRVRDVLRPGGQFVLEVQPSDSYHKARRMHPKLKEAKLELKPEQFCEVLTALGFTEREVDMEPTREEVHAGSVGPSRGFQRPLRIYVRGPD